MVNKTDYSTTRKNANSESIDQEDLEEQILERAVLRLNGNVLGIVLGIVFGLIIFAATNWLIIKGGSDVGSHLILLSQFFVGYSVSFTGSLIGMLYGLTTGYLIGFLTAWIYNRVIILKQHN